MIFIKLDRLMSGIIDFADFNINSTILYDFIGTNPNEPAVIRTRDPWIQFEHNKIQRPSNRGCSAS
jgi:hypothetical protein